MAYLERSPFFTLTKSWNPESRMPDKIRFERGNPTPLNKKKGEVTPDNGDYGLEFTIGVTLREFSDMETELAHPDNEKWQAFRKCLSGSRLTQWDNMVTQHYAQEVDRTIQAWDDAREKWLEALCNCKNARDVQYRYMGSK